MHRVLGFDSLNDFWTTLFQVKDKVMFFFAVMFGSVTFTNYFWSSPQQIIFLWIMLLLDLGTGVWYAIKSRNFTSKRLPRWAGIAFTYSVMLFVSYNMSKMVPILFFLPGSLYGLFLAVLFKSLAENFGKLGFLNLDILTKINKKIDKVLENEENEDIDDKNSPEDNNSGPAPTDKPQ